MIYLYSNNLKLKIMMCGPGCIIGLLLSLLVLLAGLFMLAYAKKEGLGRMTKIASYLAIVFATLVFVGGIICCAMMCGGCHSKKCDKEGMSCKREMKMECHKDMKMTGNIHCEKNATEHCCKEVKNDSACCAGHGEKVVKEVEIIKKEN